MKAIGFWFYYWDFYIVYHLAEYNRTHPKTAIAVKKGRVQVKQIELYICDKK